MEPCGHLESCRRRRDEQGCGVNGDLRGVRPRAGKGACGQEALNDRGGDHLDEARKLRIAHHELRLIAARIVFEHAGKLKLRQRRLVFFSEIDADVRLRVVPDHAHRDRRRAFAPLEVHQVGRLVGRGGSSARQHGERTHGGGARGNDAAEDSHRTHRTLVKPTENVRHGAEPCKRTQAGKAWPGNARPALFDLTMPTAPATCSRCPIFCSSCSPRKVRRVGAPESAIQGFLRAAGLKSIGEAKIMPDKRGDFYVAVIDKPGRPAIDVLAEIVPEVVKTFPWPKSMRWGEQSQQPGSLAWVRPLHSIVATFGPETEEPDIVAFAIDGIRAGDETRGHRFMAPQPFKVRRFEDYAAKLEKAKVVLDPERRKEMILADAKNLAFAQGYELLEDAGLLAEVAGLVEWPVVLMGTFEAAFLHMLPEIVRATIRNNQKCFVLREPRTSQLADKFILVANIEAEDGGKAITAGNERVIRARLADAKFFYDSDLKNRLEDRLPKFEDIVFHGKLGTQWERVARIERLAAELAPAVGADVEKTKRAARLAKADLLTEVVGEFPELQGVMGKYYASAQGEDASVAAACEEHYKPLGPADAVPTNPVSVAVALADKIDTLVGFWAIDEKPTGSKDPYALRRAALGIIRIALTNSKVELFPRMVFETHGKRFRTSLSEHEILQEASKFEDFFHERLK